MTDDPVRVMCASDRFFLRHVPVMLNSAISHTSGPLEIGILVKDVQPSEKRELARLFPDTPIRFFDIDGAKVAGLTYKFALSPMAYARILMTDLVDWEKFVYLDVDVIVRRDLRELYETDLGRHPVAGVLHGGSLNSGVLLINGAVWREEGLAPRILGFARENRPKEADQAAIEGTIGDRILPLDPRWNTLIDPVWAGPEQDRPDYLKDAWIVHYLTGFKPWNLGRWLLPRRLLEPWDRNRVKARLPFMPGAEAKLLAWQLRVLGMRMLGMK